MGKTRIPGLIANVKSKTDAVVRSFSENIHRLELNYRDKMRAAIELLSKYDDVEKVAELLGVKVPTARRYLGYAAVPKPIKTMVDEGKFGATTALKIVQSISDDNRAVEVAKRVAELPRSEDRLYYIGVASEKEDKSPGEALKIAKKRSEMKEIRIHVTQRVYNAVCEASKRYDLEMEHIVAEAVEEWLTRKGFINEKVK